MNGKTLTALQAKKFDLNAIKRFRVPTILLMENAGRAISEEALSIIGGKQLKVAIVCGKGNNGGDGFCSARHLITKGITLDVYVCGKLGEIKAEAKANLDILLKLKRKIFILNEKNLKIFKRRLSRYGLIIDAILGVGLKGRVKGVIFEVINIINQSGVYVLSADIPSGVNADTGEALGAAVYADRTVTFVAPKKGMEKNTGKRFCGKVVVSDGNVK